MNTLIATVAAALFFILSGCQSQPPTAAIEKTVYEWEKANVDFDYQAQQKLLYTPGTYEVAKTAEKVNSGLKINDIQYQIYQNKNGWYDVLATYTNPVHGNDVKDAVVVRQKGGQWKVDVDRGLELQGESYEQFRDQDTQIACINCNK